MKTPALALLLLAAAVAAPAQTSDVVTETVSVNYVMIPFTPIGTKGRPIANLQEKDVSLFVDGAPVARDLFEKSQNAPVSFVILLDGSGSMALAGKMEAARAALSTLISRRKPGDEFALYVFDNHEAHEAVPFTEDADKVLKALSEVKPYGKTAFFDALASMPERTEMGKNPTRAIVLLSDGIDNASKLTRRTLPPKLEGVPVPIYSLGLRPAAEKARLKKMPVSEELSDIGLLDEISNNTGGKLFLGTKPQDFIEAANSLDRDLRIQYLIGFTPTGKGAVKYRRISLKVAGRVNTVRVRAGYRGTEPPVLSATRKSKRG